jgi:hypothetical protein
MQTIKNERARINIEQEEINRKEHRDNFFVKAK